MMMIDKFVNLLPIHLLALATLNTHRSDNVVDPDDATSKSTQTFLSALFLNLAIAGGELAGERSIPLCMQNCNFLKYPLLYSHY
jgi:hypothetical protein